MSFFLPTAWRFVSRCKSAEGKKGPKCVEAGTLTSKGNQRGIPPLFPPRRLLREGEGEFGLRGRGGPKPRSQISAGEPPIRMKQRWGREGGEDKKVRHLPISIILNCEGIVGGSGRGGRREGESGRYSAYRLCVKLERWAAWRFRLATGISGKKKKKKRRG